MATVKQFSAALLAATAFAGASQAQDLSPGDLAGARPPAASTSSDRDQCVSIARQPGALSVFPSARKAFASSGNLGCEFALNPQGGASFMQSYPLTTTQGQRGYSSAMNRANALEARGAAHEQRRFDQEQRRTDSYGGETGKDLNDTARTMQQGNRVLREADRAMDIFKGFGR